MLNSIVLMGRLVAEPELKTTTGGVSVCTFRIAVDRDYSGRNGEDRQTDFIDIVAWRQTADFVTRYFSKGSMIVVQGSLQSRKWQDRNGNSRVTWEVQAASVWFGESSRRSESDRQHEPRSEASTEPRTEPREVLSRAEALGVPVTPNSSAEDFLPVTGEDLPF